MFKLLLYLEEKCDEKRVFDLQTCGFAVRDSYNVLVQIHTRIHIMNI